MAVDACACTDSEASGEKSVSLLARRMVKVCECVSIVETQIFSQSGKGISVKLYIALKKCFVRVLRRVVVEEFYV